MDSSKWRISKACHECRARKTRCDGDQPCERCRQRGLTCAYREKARHRPRRHPEPPPPSAAASQEANVNDGASEQSSHPGTGGERSIHSHAHSVAATLRAPVTGHVLQLYYGPSSNFSLLNSIYHQIEGTRPNSPSRNDLQEVGPGLDLFSHRRLFFGDLADARKPPSAAGDSSAIFLDLPTSQSFLDRYLASYWNGLPVGSKDEWRKRLNERFAGPSVLSFETHDDITMSLALALGAHMAAEHSISEFLFEKARKAAAMMEDVVNVHMVHIYVMMISLVSFGPRSKLTAHHSQLQLERALPNSAFLQLGTAARRAVAVGLHKESGCSRAAGDQQDLQRRRIVFWALYVWETWVCFVVGRPSSIPDPGPAVPVPKDQLMLQSLVTLARIMSKCVSGIYSQRHDSLLRLWNAANDIRQELGRFAEQQIRDAGSDESADWGQNDRETCQAMLATMSQHTTLLTFRPFLILRARLRQEASSQDESASQAAHNPPPWLNSACEYCLEAARNTLDFLSGAFREHALLQEVKYHAFFIEGACYVLAFDLLQDPNKDLRNLPWVRMGLRCLRSMLSNGGSGNYQTPNTIAAIEQMLRTASPELVPEPGMDSDWPYRDSRQGQPPAIPSSSARFPESGAAEESFLYSSMPFGFDIGGGAPGNAPAMVMPDGQADFTAADMGWDIDFGTMDMDAFLSIDPSQNWGSRS